MHGPVHDGGPDPCRQHENSCLKEGYVYVLGKVGIPLLRRVVSPISKSDINDVHIRRQESRKLKMFDETSAVIREGQPLEKKTSFPFFIFIY